VFGAFHLPLAIARVCAGNPAAATIFEKRNSDSESENQKAKAETLKC
jgi:hypothetical protein